MKQQISHNNLPEALEWLIEKVNSMDDILREFIVKPVKTKSNKDILTAKETAKYLNITTVTLHNWAKQGKITKNKIGGTRIGFKATDVESLLFKIENKRS